MPKTDGIKSLSFWCDWINDKISYVAAILLFLMLIFSGVAIFFRYVMSDPLAWAGDILLAAFVWMGFLGITIAFRSACHVKIDSIVGSLSPKWRDWIFILTQTIVVVFSIYLTIEGFKVVMASLSTHSGVLRWPPTYFYAAFPTAFSLISLYGIDDICRRIRQLRPGLSETGGEIYP